MNEMQQRTNVLPESVEEDPVLKAVIVGLSKESEPRRPLSELMALMDGSITGPEFTFGEWCDAMFQEELRWYRERPFREREKRLRAEEAKRQAKEQREREREARRQSRGSSSNGRKQAVGTTLMD